MSDSEDEGCRRSSRRVDAFAWIRADWPGKFGDRTGWIGELGDSAGGYLILARGYLVEPCPAAPVSYWGRGDIAGTCYSRPDPFYRDRPLVPEAEARAAVGTRVIAEPPPMKKRGRFDRRLGYAASAIYLGGPVVRDLSLLEISSTVDGFSTMAPLAG